MKKIFSVRVISGSLRIRIPPGFGFESGNVIMIELDDENRIVITKVASCRDDLIKNRGDDVLSFETL